MNMMTSQHSPAVAASRTRARAPRWRHLNGNEGEVDRRFGDHAERRRGRAATSKTNTAQSRVGQPPRESTRRACGLMGAG
jgi:hypothetical protein